MIGPGVDAACCRPGPCAGRRLRAAGRRVVGPLGRGRPTKPCPAAEEARISRPRRTRRSWCTKKRPTTAAKWRPTARPEERAAQPGHVLPATRRLRAGSQVSPSPTAPVEEYELRAPEEVWLRLTADRFNGLDGPDVARHFARRSLSKGRARSSASGKCRSVHRREPPFTCKTVPVTKRTRRWRDRKRPHGNVHAGRPSRPTSVR